MQNIMDYLYHICSIFLFCMAISLILFENKEMNQFIHITKDQLKNNNTLYERIDDGDHQMENNKVSYSELISMLCSDLEYDLQINDIVIEAKNYQQLNFDLSRIPYANYTKSYQLDENGMIVKIIYLSMKNS